jgi:nuclear pore complex protein Nup93
MVLISCGAFEMGVASLYHHQELQVEAVHLAIALAYYGLLRVPSRIEASEVEICRLPYPTLLYYLIVSIDTQTKGGQSTLNLYLLISRYVRQFIRSDPREAMQYVYNICLSDRQGPASGKEQIELAWELTRRIIVGAEHNSSREELVGAFRPDGVRVVSAAFLLLNVCSQHLGWSD